MLQVWEFEARDQEYRIDTMDRTVRQKVETHSNLDRRYQPMSVDTKGATPVDPNSALGIELQHLVKANTATNEALAMLMLSPARDLLAASTTIDQAIAQLVAARRAIAA